MPAPLGIVILSHFKGPVASGELRRGPFLFIIPDSLFFCNIIYLIT